jgi:hypothetical protein
MTEPTTPARRRSRRASATAPAAPAGSQPIPRATEAVPPGETSFPSPAPRPLADTRSGQDIASVTVGSLRLERGGIGEATADSVEVRMGGIGRVDAEDVYVQWGGIGAGRADTMSVEFGSVGAAAAGELRVTQGVVSNVIAREATVEQGFVRTLIAQHVTFSRPSAVLVLIAGRVTGDVRPLIDWRGALAAGLALGLVGAVARALRER